MKLSQIEQETIILYNQEESTAEVYTYDPKLLAKLEMLAQKHPAQVTRKNDRSFLVPKKCICVREPYDEQRRVAARERALSGGYRPPKRGAAKESE